MNLNFSSSANFLFFFRKTILEILQWRQIVLVQIRPDILLGLCWVQLFVKITSRQHYMQQVENKSSNNDLH